MYYSLNRARIFRADKTADEEENEKESKENVEGINTAAVNNKT